MTLTQFKKALKAYGKLTYAEVAEASARTYTRCARGLPLADVIPIHTTPHEILDEAIKWYLTSQGRGFWADHYAALKEGELLAARGDILHGYEITKDFANSDLIVGCQRITLKRQRKLFKLLASQLGYTIQGKGEPQDEKETRKNRTR